MSNGIMDKIAEISKDKRLIRNAIYSKRVDISDSDPFSEYPEKIREIPTETTTITQQAVITKNGRYDLELGTACDRVDVDVRAVTGKKTVTENGTYRAEDDELDGYSELTVDIPIPKPNVKEKKIASVDLPDEIEPITFDASEEKVDGYSIVTFDPRGKFGQKEIKVDPNNYSAETTIYDATDDNLYGYSKLVINILEDRGPFSVEFWSENTRLKTVSVEKNQRAEYTGKTPEKEGYTFVGWNPDPINVTENMRCYAEFEASSISHVDSTTHKIKSTWRDIAKNGGKNIPLGSTIKLSFARTDGGNGIVIPGGTLEFMKVYEGECGTASTWVSTAGIPLPSEGIKLFDGKEYGGWKEWRLRKVLNGPFLASISVMTADEDIKESAAIVPAIKPVTKFTEGIAVDIIDFLNEKSDWCPYIPNQVTVDKVWVLSDQEYGNTGVETDGVSYDEFFDGTGYDLVRSASGQVLSQSCDVKRIGQSSWEYPWAGQNVGYVGYVGWTGSGTNPGKMFGWHNKSWTDAYKQNVGSTVIENWEPSYIKANIHIGFCT